ncbi:uncharacterized protein LOC131848792 [Achroia grisella]|uniref:uncharacterized protein LOC131848792 n=1 Tax=Achroia grisella TaxID=688607 RepID=UPI0027D22D21|nr:uncharacterized protein LOC131848792 [Achroia grisella]
MGRKRKLKKTDDEIMKKIKKLEKKLVRRRRVMRLSSSSNNADSVSHISMDETVPVCTETVTSPIVPTATPACTDAPGHIDLIKSPLEDQPSLNMHTAIAADPNSDIAAPSAVVPNTEDNELDESILALLGDTPQNDPELGPPVHKDLALRWQDVLCKGLNEETKKKMLSNYHLPNNLENLIPPSLNAEVKAALPELMVKRDYSLLQRQKQISIAISALSKSMDILITDKTIMVPQTVLRPFSDACRLLCDTFYNETRTRRSLIINSINIQMKNSIIDTTPTKLLFGDNLTERLKTAQNIKRSGDILKPIQRPFNKSNFIKNGPGGYINKNLNQRGPYRKFVPADTGRPRPQTRTASATATPASSSYRGRSERRSSPNTRTSLRARQRR